MMISDLLYLSWLLCRSSVVSMAKGPFSKRTPNPLLSGTSSLTHTLLLTIKLISLRILLTHTLGLPYDILDPDIMKWSKLNSRTDWAMSWNRSGFATPIRFTPGEGWLYGPALDWAGLALQAITGDTLGAYMQRHVFDPLNMQDTGFWPGKLESRGVEERGVEPVERKEGGKLEGVQPWEPAEHEIESGGAGLYSTAGDYAKFLQGFIRGEVVSETSMQEMFTPQLNDAQRTAMETIAYKLGEEARLGFAPEFPVGAPINHGLAGIINLEDVEGKRRKGSIMWSGMVNSRWVSATNISRSRNLKMDADSVTVDRS